MKCRRFEELPVWLAARDLFVRVDPCCEPAQATRRGDLADRLHRAAVYVSNIIADGLKLGTTQQFLSHAEKRARREMFEAQLARMVDDACLKREQSEKSTTTVPEALE